MRFEERKKNGNVDVDQKRKAEQSSTAPNSLLDLARLVHVLEAKGLVLDDLLVFFGCAEGGEGERTQGGEFFCFPSMLSIRDEPSSERRLSQRRRIPDQRKNFTLTLVFCLAASWAFFCLSMGGIVSHRWDSGEERSQKKYEEKRRGDDRRKSRHLPIKPRALTNAEAASFSLC